MPNSVPTVNRSLKPKPETGNTAAVNSEVHSAANVRQKGENLPVVKNKTDLAELRRALDEGQRNTKVKDTNTTKQLVTENITDDVQPKPPAPVVNRSLKPAVNSEAAINEDVESQELEALKQTTAQRQGELQDLQAENKRLALEHTARIAKLRDEEEKIDHLREMKSKEMKETADLMRMKKKVEEEIRQLEEEKNVREREEQKRYRITPYTMELWSWGGLDHKNSWCTRE